ncbi:hypothetical protein Tco_0533833 [Tanacetum coccineum]
MTRQNQNPPPPLAAAPPSTIADPPPSIAAPCTVPLPPNHARHPSPFFNPNLIRWNWDDVIVISSNDEDGEEEDIPTGLSFILKQLV